MALTFSFRAANYCIICFSLFTSYYFFSSYYFSSSVIYLFFLASLDMYLGGECDMAYLCYPLRGILAWRPTPASTAALSDSASSWPRSNSSMLFIPLFFTTTRRIFLFLLVYTRYLSWPWPSKLPSILSLESWPSLWLAALRPGLLLSNGFVVVVVAIRLSTIAPEEDRYAVV